MSDDPQAYKDWILSADPRSLITQLHQELRNPLTNAQNLTNLLIMMMNPSPKIQQKIESGELNAEAMLTSVVESLQRAFSVLDFYREAFEE